MKQNFNIDFVGIGTEKSGTTTIARLLEEHPEICLSEPKEVQYFNKEYSYRLQGRENPNVEKDLNWYANHYNHCKKDAIKGEFSVNYFIGPEVPKKIYTLNPNAKLIVSFRNPVKRAYSAYQFNKHFLKLKDMDSFEESLEKHFEYIEMGQYHKHLQRFLKYFNRDQIFVIIFEDFIQNQKVVMSDLFSFLGVNDEFVPPSIGKKSNSAKKTKLNWLKDFERFFVKRLSAVGFTGFIQWLKKIGVNKWTMAMYSEPLNYEKLDAYLEKKLEQKFMSDTIDLSNFLDKDLVEQWFSKK